MVKVSNDKKEGSMIHITTERNLSKIFIDVCGPFPWSGVGRRYKFIVIIWDHHSKYTKLYPISKASTNNILAVIYKYIEEIGTPECIITDHGTQFKGRKWKESLLKKQIKTYKTTVYHPSSNPAERVLREVGRILRTYCHDNHDQWSNYIKQTEQYLNLAHHDTLGVTPYQMMFHKPPPRCITDIIEFPTQPETDFDVIKVYNRISLKNEQRKNRQWRNKTKPIQYKVGDKVLIRNRKLPSSVEGIAKKLLLLYVGPYRIIQDNGNNTYKLEDIKNKCVKGTYNQTELKRFCE